MNLNFQRKFANGKPTNFIPKIWAGFAIDDYLYHNFESDSFKEAYPYPDKDACLDSWLSHKPKIHTIRADEKDLWHVGRLIHFSAWSHKPYASKIYRFAPIVKVQAIQRIEIINPTEYFNDTIIKIDGRQLGIEEMQQLAWNDGFENLISFQMYFNTDFKGKIIHWTQTEY